MKKQWVLLAWLLLFVAACNDEALVDEPTGSAVVEFGGEEDGGGETAVSPPPSSTYTPTDCPFAADTDREVDCGILVVPENRTLADSPTIELAIGILRAASSDPLRDPVVFLTGGPGDSALADLATAADSWTEYPFTELRDVIFIDQRGTGYSQPFLDCPEFDEDSENGEQQCHERLLDEGIDLTAYNTAENAADVADLMQALGIDEYNLLGVSYGTRLALVVMRDHPAGVRAVVLDSPFPPNARTPQEEAVAIWDGIQAVLADCAADPDCADRYPDLEDKLIEAVIQLNEEPLGNLIGDDILAVIEKMMFSSEEYGSLIPLLIEQVYNGEYDLFEYLTQELLGYGRARRQADEEGNSSEGMYNSVICRDEYAFASEAEAEAEIAANIPEPLQTGLALTTFQLYETCSYWGAGVAAAVENEAVVSDIPTLVLVGEYDPATPPAWARLTVETLANGYLFELPGGGHSLLSTNQCAIDLMEAFWEEPWVEPNGRCVDELGELVFE
ncbi:MAG: alpha/beta fold hydrolase [Chloroflexota bacterium]